MSRRCLIFLALASLFCLAFAQPHTLLLDFSGGGFVSSVQMTGTATQHYGSDEQSGLVRLQAYADGRSSLELLLDHGAQAEIQNASSDDDRACTQAGHDGVAHSVATHNCWLATVWFLPQITMQGGAGPRDGVLSSVSGGDGKTVMVHLERYPSNVRDKRTASLLAKVSAADLAVDSTTRTPRSLIFKIHPDNDANIDLLVEIDFSDYRSVKGITVPFHIQKFINNSLVLDMLISDVQPQFATPVL